MSTPEHRPPNNKQLEILRLLYRFRFATTELLTQALELKSKIKMNERLKILLDQEYIGRNFEPEYRLLRKHATYYLLPKGVEALKQIPDNKFDALTLRNTRKDKTASDQFIEYNLSIFSLYCNLKSEFGDSLRFFTKSQLANRYDYFSEFVPSVYMSIAAGDTEKDYFLEYLQSSKPFFTVIQRLKQYTEYADSGEWEDETNSDFPAVLLVCDNPRLQDRLVKRSGFALNEADDDLKFYTATLTKLKTWRNLVDQDEEPRPLTSI
jgi:hypothetical protein